MRRSLRNLSVLALAAFGFASALTLDLAARQAAPAGTTVIDPLILQNLKWRSIGPTDRAGRSIAISGVKGRPNEGYVGQVGGGLSAE